MGGWGASPPAPCPVFLLHWLESVQIPRTTLWGSRGSPWGFGGPDVNLSLEPGYGGFHALDRPSVSGRSPATLALSSLTNAFMPHCPCTGPGGRWQPSMEEKEGIVTRCVSRTHGASNARPPVTCYPHPQDTQNAPARGPSQRSTGVTRPVAKLSRHRAPGEYPDWGQKGSQPLPHGMEKQVLLLLVSCGWFPRTTGLLLPQPSQGSPAHRKAEDRVQRPSSGHAGARR